MHAAVLADELFEIVRLAGHGESPPEVGKYNAGQKMVFWLMPTLITGGLRERYFALSYHPHV
jgi:hypothetical protein